MIKSKKRTIQTVSTILSILLIAYSLQAKTTEDLQREFAELRFGAFIHFGIRTFTGGSWGAPDQDVTKFNPTDLDCGQWADAFISAKMGLSIMLP